MEELMAYRFTDTPTMDRRSVRPFDCCTDSDTFFPAADYAGYQYSWAITYLDCNGPGSHCGGEVGYTGISLTTTSNRPRITSRST